MKPWTALLLCLLAGPLSANTFASFNIRYDNPKDQKAGNGWQRRLPVIRDLIRFHRFDVFGTQEALPHQMADLREQLDEYSAISFGREEGDEGEHTGIFFRTSAYELLDHGCFWLSESPQTVSTGWDARLPRICTWTRLQERASEREFYVFNTHFDHIGQKARLKSAELILEQITRIAKGQPILLLGDFNASQTSQPYQTLNRSPRLADAFEKAPLRLTRVGGTMNQFDPKFYSEHRIDHIFVSPDFEVTRFGILTDHYRPPATAGDDKDSGTVIRFPSDHYPVLVDVDWAH